MMVVRITSLVIAVLANVLQPIMSAHAEDIPTEPAYLYRAVVVRVIDGDTIDVDVDLGFYVWIQKQRIRLFGIDAPEVTGETAPEIADRRREHHPAYREGGRWRGSR